MRRHEECQARRTYHAWLSFKWSDILVVGLKASIAGQLTRLNMFPSSFEAVSLNPFGLLRSDRRTRVIIFRIATEPGKYRTSTLNGYDFDLGEVEHEANMLERIPHCSIQPLSH